MHLKIDQKCQPTKTDVPQQQCSPRYEERCEHLHKTVEEKRFKEECNEEIKHVCEEHIHIPVVASAPLVKPPSPAPIFPEHNQYSLPRSFRQKRDSKSSADAEPKAEADPEAYHIPKEFLEALLQQERQKSEHNRFQKAGDFMQLNNYQDSYKQISKQSQFIDEVIENEGGGDIHNVRERQSHNTLGGTILSSSVTTRPNLLHGLGHINHMPLTTSPTAFIGSSSRQNQNNSPTSEQITKDSNSHSRSIDPGLLRQESLETQIKDAMMELLRENSALGASFQKLAETPHTKDNLDLIFSEADTEAKFIPGLGAALVSEELNSDHLATNEQHPHPHLAPADHHTQPNVAPVDPHSHPHIAPVDPHSHPPKELEHLEHPPPVPTVTIKELPAEPGCRSFSTTTCTQIPIGKTLEIKCYYVKVIFQFLVVPKTVPYDECRAVPAVDCYFILKTVDDLECSPVSFEECKDEVVDVPYLEDEEKCEEIEFDECVDIEEQVPIQVCTVVDPNRKPIVNREIEGSRRRTGGKKTGNTVRPSIR